MGQIYLASTFELHYMRSVEHLLQQRKGEIILLTLRTPLCDTRLKPSDTTSKREEVHKV